MSDFAHLDGTFSTGSGTVTARPLLGGVANVAEVRVPGGPQGISLKVQDQATGIWSVWWLPAAGGGLGPPRRGRWDDGRAWLAGVEPDGVPWAYALSDVTAEGSHWEQHRSDDGGRTWVVESAMDLVRTGPVVDPPAAGDFAFLARTLSVAHRRRAETFTSTHRGVTLLDGTVSVDEVGLTDGRTGMTFRARDAATGLWSIWWVDSSRGRLEPPVVGRFGAGGVGTFLGAEEDQLVRFTWSDVATASPHWRQDLSADGGRTWVTDWEMSFS